MKPKMKRPFNSIQSTMLFLFSSLIIAALLVFLIISLHYTENTVVNNSTDYTMQLISQVNNDIDSYIEYMENISLMFSNNSDILNFVSAKYTTSSKGTVEWVRIAKLFSTIMEARSDIYNIGIISDDGRYVLNYGYDELNPYTSLEKLDWCKNALRADGKSVLSSSHVQTAIRGDYKWVITMSCILKDTISREPDGIFFIDLNYDAIGNLCQRINLGNKGYVFILDNSGEIIYHPKQQLLYNGLKTEETEKVLSLNGNNGHFIVDTEDNDSKLYTVCTSENTGWTIVGVSYTSELMKNKQETQALYIIVAIILLILSLLFSTLISNAITRPLRALQKSMAEVEKGNFDNAVLPVTDNTEIGSLSNSFNIMTTEIQNLMQKIIDEQKQKRKSELRALQAQINPHFLYNTLDSIIWTAEIGKNEDVVLMTSSLAKLLRQSISNENELVPIKDEISYTQTYLTIQKMRYQDKLEFFIDVDEDIFEHSIIKLILQPLVENAIYHGIKYKEGIGIIYISGGFEDDTIAIHVEDNGSGMDSDTLAHIFEKKPDKQKNSRGVGIHNVQGRLKLYYGDSYGLSYESSLGNGTTATIRIPVKEDYNP